MFVSSRATGGFNGVKNGADIVDEKSFDLNTFDFVLDPGFVQASPSLQESLCEGITIESLEEDAKVVFGESKPTIDPVPGIVEDASDPPITLKRRPQPGDKPNEGESKMGEVSAELFESVTRDKVAAENQLTEALVANKKLEDANVKQSGELDALKKAREEDQEKISKLEADQKVHESMAWKMEELGTPEEIRESMRNAETMLSEYQALGTPEQIKDAFDKSEKVATKLEGLGDISAIAESISFQEEVLRNFGTIEEIQECIDKTKIFVDRVEEMGKLADIEEALTKAEAMSDRFNDHISDSRVQALVDELGVSEDAVIKLVDKGLDDNEIREVLKSVSEASNLQRRYRMPINEGRGNNGDEDEPDNPFTKPRGQKLMEEFSH